MPNKAVVHKHGHYSLTASRLTSSAGSWSLNSSILDSVSWTMPSAMFTASTRSCQQHPLVQRNLEYPQQSAFGKSGPNGLHRTNIHITFLLLSSSAYLSAFLIIFSMSSLLRPPEDWITTGSHKVQRERFTSADLHTGIHISKLGQTLVSHTNTCSVPAPIVTYSAARGRCLCLWPRRGRYRWRQCQR